MTAMYALACLARRATGAVLLIALAGPVAAQVTAAPAQATAPAPAEAVAQRTVIEDDGARIEETRLRGAPQRITVQSKLGKVAPYEIIVGPAGRDPAQDRGATGQRAWSVLSF